MSARIVRPTKSCIQCGVEFTPKENALVRRERQRFCSHACHRRSRIHSRVVVVDDVIAHLLLPCGAVGLLSAADAPLVAGLACNLDPHGYVVCTNRGSRRLHRVLMRAPKNVLVDHRNGVRHDNRRENLRFATERVNSRNRHHASARSGVMGVQRLERPWGLRYLAFVHVDRRRIHLGTFGSLDEAAAARRGRRGPPLGRRAMNDGLIVVAYVSGAAVGWAIAQGCRVACQHFIGARCHARRAMAIGRTH